MCRKLVKKYCLNDQPLEELLDVGNKKLEEEDFLGAIFNFDKVILIDPSNAEAFQKAHEKLVKSTSKTRGDRPVAFGTFDVGGGGASHWVAIGSSDFDDLMDQKVKAEKNNSKEWAEWWKTNGGFENKGNFVIRVLATFGSL